MEHTHDYPDGSKQEPFEIPDLDDVIRQRPNANFAETVDSAREKLLEQLGLLRRSNKAKFDEMIRMGVQPAPTAIIMARMEQLLDMLLDEDSRIGFDLGFEARMAEILDEGMADARRHHLTGARPANGRNDWNGNGGPPPGLILPG